MKKNSDQLTFLFAFVSSQACTLVPEFQGFVAVFVLISHFLMFAYLWKTF